MMYYGPYSDNLSTFTLLKQIPQIPQNLLLARVNEGCDACCRAGEVQGRCGSGAGGAGAVQAICIVCTATSITSGAAGCTHASTKGALEGSKKEDNNRQGSSGNYGPPKLIALIGRVGSGNHSRSRVEFGKQFLI